MCRAIDGIKFKKETRAQGSLTPDPESFMYIVSQEQEGWLSGVRRIHIHQ